MRINTPAVVASLLQNPDQWLTPVGSFLRKSNLDELPQLWSILKGEVPPGVPLWTKYLLWLRRNSQPNIALSSFYGSHFRICSDSYSDKPKHNGAQALVCAIINCPIIR
jgi:hypothetical protein